MKQASHLKETTSFDVKKINDPNSSSINTVYSVRQIRVRPVLQLQGNPVDAILKGGTKKKKFFYVFRKLHRPNHISEEDAKFKPSNLFIVGQKKKKSHLISSTCVSPSIYKETFNPLIQPLRSPVCICGHPPPAPHRGPSCTVRLLLFFHSVRQKHLANGWA